MGKVPCCEKEKVKRGQWTPEEDNKLSSYIAQHGTRNWRLIPKNVGLQRCGKSCRLRWTNYLRPDLKHGQFSSFEEETIMKLHAVVGNRWSLIAAQLPGRTDNDVKNHWNTKLKKTLTGMGIDPVTHKSFSHLMAEIATTLGPPQVANLTEAALGCFKDEMLHLLTKNRIESQLLPVPFNNTITSANTTMITTIDTTYPHPNNNHLNMNNNCDNSNVIVLGRKADDHQGTMDNDTHDDQVHTVDKIKIGLSRAIRHCPPPYHNDILISNNNNDNDNNIMKPCWDTITQEQVNTFTEFQYGQSSFGHDNNKDEDEENDGSPWSQSTRTGSNSTAGGDQAVGYLKLDQQGHENNNTTTHGDEDDSQSIIIKEIRNGSGGIFSSDCVLWDLPSNELVNPII